MSEKFKEFLQRWLISTVAVLIATYVVPGIHYQHWLDLLVATFILGILNTFVRPILMFVSLPLLIFTLGLFTLIINALLLYFVGYLLEPKFKVDSFGAAFWAALVITIVTLILNSLTGTGGAQIKIQRGKPRRDDHDEGDGPVIDV
ncbi:MAG: phage holin family protein [Verrucomicrobia subdivision 3 bacterium]|nr:phage holin family protein [Limisphaerales bacterium]